MNQDVREMLDQIDQFLSTKPSETAEQLWDVLCALRGPDDQNYALKLSTTAVVRVKAFPIVASYQSRMPIKLPADFRKDDSEKATVRKSSGFIPSHFIDHARWAFATLGLDWNHFNK